jgi:hypothetical protein
VARAPSYSSTALSRGVGKAALDCAHRTSSIHPKLSFQARQPFPSGKGTHVGLSAAVERGPSQGARSGSTGPTWVSFPSFSSCAFREQEGHLATPHHLLQACLLYLSGNGTRSGPTAHVERALSDSLSLSRGVAEAALYCAHRTSTVSSCAFCEQEGHLAAPCSPLESSF